MTETVVGKTSPTLAVTGPATATVGHARRRRSSISATLTGGYNPTGTSRSYVFGPQASAPTTCTSGGTTFSGTDSSSPYNPSSFLDAERSRRLLVVRLDTAATRTTTRPPAPAAPA